MMRKSFGFLACLQLIVNADNFWYCVFNKANKNGKWYALMLGIVCTTSRHQSTGLLSFEHGHVNPTDENARRSTPFKRRSNTHKMEFYRICRALSEFNELIIIIRKAFEYLIWQNYLSADCGWDVQGNGSFRSKFARKSFHTKYSLGGGRTPQHTLFAFICSYLSRVAGNEMNKMCWITVESVWLYVFIKSCSFAKG